MMKANGLLRRIAICGDDFGMDASVDHAILHLVGAGRMTAVSCMTLGPAFASNAQALPAGKTDIGLHLNLSENLAPADAMPSLRGLLLSAYSGRLDSAWVHAQIVRQLDAFEDVMGRAPDYIDGHQHVHQLPGVRQLLVNELSCRYSAQRPWLRMTVPGMQQGLPWKSTIKAHVIAALGGHALAAAARRDGWHGNNRFFGAYDFQGGSRAYCDLLHHWLANALDGDLIMTHPALPGRTEHAVQRQAEFEVLASDALGAWMAGNGVALERQSAMRPQQEMCGSGNFRRVATTGEVLISR